jgi:hypothetical protein
MGSQSIVSVQVGDHSEFVRLSLSWPQPISFDYVRTAVGFEVRFFQKSELLLDRLISIFPGSSYRHESNQTVLNIRVSPARKFIAKSYGNITYLDIYKDGVQDLKLVPHPGIKDSHSVFAKKTEGKPPDVDLQNLFRKVADYLGELKPDLESTVLATKGNGLLLKYPDAPIAVYKNEQKVYIVVLKDGYPVLEKKLEEKFSIQLTQSKGAFVLQLPVKDFTNPIVTRGADGWCIEFEEALPLGKIPQFLIKESDTQVKMNRSGLFDPVEVGGVTVFCSLNPDIFVPIHFNRENMNMLATSVGAAFKTDDPEKIVIDRDFITLLAESGSLPQDATKKINFKRYESLENFSLQKQKLLDVIVNAGGNDVEARIELIQLYLSKTFSSEAVSEIKALESDEKDYDPDLIALLSSIAEVIEVGVDRGSSKKLFPFHEHDLESAAWYAFALAQSGGQNIPLYLGEYLVASIDAFPEPLKSMLLIKLTDKLILQNDIDLAEAVVQKINESQLSSDLVFFKQFLQIKINKIKNKQVDVDERKRLLGEAQQPLLEVRLIMETGVVDWKQKDHYQYIETLEMLVPLIEGDPYYTKVLQYLIEYNFLIKNHLKALDLALILKKDYRSAYEKIRPKIQSVIGELVNGKTLEQGGLIYTLQVLNQFAEDLPVNTYMVEYILNLTQKMHRIGLLEESIRLVENFFSREDARLRTKRQRKVFYQLADFYIKNEDTAKAKSLINMINTDVELTKDDLEKMQVLKARLALMDGKSEDALEFLHTSHSLDGLKLKTSLLWEKDNWSGAADALEELIDTHLEKLEGEPKERYIVHLAAALALNEEKHHSKNIGRQKTRITLQGVFQKYEGVLSKYKVLFQELITEPHNSMTDTLSRSLVINEINETDRLESLFNQLKAVPTN